MNSEKLTIQQSFWIIVMANSLTWTLIFGLVYIIL